MFPFFLNFFDKTIILVIIGILMMLFSTFYVKYVFNKFKNIKCSNNKTVLEIVKYILNLNDIKNIKINKIYGELNDNYDIKKKELNLSNSSINSSSIVSIGIAAHECGHAIQDNIGYGFLKINFLLIPFVNICSSFYSPIIFVGLLLNSNKFLLNFGIFLFFIIFFYQLLILPIEINASYRALNILKVEKLLLKKELVIVKHVLFAAALTYLASVLSSFLQLLRLIILFNRNDDR